MDGDALYTLIMGLKPMTTAYAQRFPESRSGLATHFRVKSGELGQLRHLESLNAALSCGGDIIAGAAVMSFSTAIGDSRIVWPYLANGPALREVLAARQELYGRYFITEYTHPTALLMTIAATPRIGQPPRESPDASRMFGYLFGYPEYAVEWMSQHGQPHSPAGEPRFGFYSIRAYEPGPGFSWTTEKDHAENEADHRIRAHANAILEEYKKRRERYVGPGKPGVVALLRDWLDDGHGNCAVANAVVAGFK